MARRGFTLVEALMVLLLVGAIIYAGTITFLNLIPKMRLQSALWEIHSSLNEARFSAIWKGKARRVSFQESGYCLERYDEQDKTWKTVRGVSLPDVFIKASNSPTFHPGGTVSNLASISISNSRGAYKLTIAISGRIKSTKLE